MGLKLTLVVDPSLFVLMVSYFGAVGLSKQHVLANFLQSFVVQLFRHGLQPLDTGFSTHSGVVAVLNTYLRQEATEIVEGQVCC